MQGIALKLRDFVGNWSLERQIDDLRTGTLASFSGNARFEPSDSDLLYGEQGQLKIPNADPLTATRQYLWRDCGDRVSVHFDDGRAFHEFKLSGGASGARHWCDPDQYDVTYDFSEWPLWRSRWRVNGPRKDYVMDSRYRRG